MSRWNMRAVISENERRDQEFIDYDDGDSFWWSETGFTVRWALFAGLVTFIMLYLILGYLHAKRRIRKGLVPLRYHRFLLSRKERALHDPSYRQSLPEYTIYRPDQYGMHAYPPPVYDPNAPAPPSYQPPAGATKVDPLQSRAGPMSNRQMPGEPSPEYAPPSGPPPTTTPHPGQRESITESNNPYRQ